jgi:protein-L-isoaspartate(D-aspartate) O-methyltransferase
MRDAVPPVPADGESDASALHQALVDQLKEAGRIRTSHVEAAFRAVPRHLFVPGVPLELVYHDEAIPTKHLDGATVSSSSQPAIMAFMLEQLQLEPGHHVLEIGAGTGYNAALLAHIVGDPGRVVTVDIDEDLVASARKQLSAAGFNRVQVVCGDGGRGYPDGAPFDRIILSVGAGDILPAWQEQLKSDGRLVLPLSIRGPQVSVAFKPADGHLMSVSVGACGFMMLRGAFAEPGTLVQLGSQPGLHVSVDASRPVDAPAVYQWLSGPSRDESTRVSISPGEAFGELRLWLALHEPGFCDLSAEGEWVDRGMVPYLFGWNGGGWKLCCTSGLITETGLCALMRPPVPSLSPERLPGSPFELSFRSFGSDQTLAHYLMEQITAWDTAGRPSTNSLRIKAYPPGTEYIPSPNETVVQKRWTRLVIDWR